MQLDYNDLILGGRAGLEAALATGYRCTRFQQALDTYRAEIRDPHGELVMHRTPDFGDWDTFGAFVDTSTFAALQAAAENAYPPPAGGGWQMDCVERLLDTLTMHRRHINQMAARRNLQFVDPSKDGDPWATGSNHYIPQSTTPQARAKALEHLAETVPGCLVWEKPQEDWVPVDQITV